MCLGIPGRVCRWIDQGSTFACAEVDFGGVRRDVQMACVPEANVGDYVIVHAGIAICRIDEQEASRALQEFQTLNDLTEDDEITR